MRSVDDGHTVACADVVGEKVERRDFAWNDCGRARSTLVRYRWGKLA